MKKQIIQLTVLTLSFFCILSPAFGQWPKYVDDNNVTTAVNVDIGDTDGDTRPDRIVAAFGIGKFQWYQNNYPNRIPYTIDSNGIMKNLTFACF